MVGKRKAKSKAKSSKVSTVDADVLDLDRFAGSSDEEQDEDSGPPPINVDHDADDEEESDGDDDDEEEEEKPKAKREVVIKTGDGTTVEPDERDNDDEILQDDELIGDNEDDHDDENLESSEKMSNVMARILGSGTKKGKGATLATSSSVVLAKTVTPLQRLQKQEKEQIKAIKEKRQAKKERNLTALHIPLSIATTNSVSVKDGGRGSVSKELEQERFHRRVATRGVVALFNAISQHQKSTTETTQSVSSGTKRNEKMTKHGFLDKIKSAAVTATATSSSKVENSNRNEAEEVRTKEKSGWNALKDDYLLNPKTNWDEESSDEDEEVTSSIEDDAAPGKKRRRVAGRE